MGSQETEGLVCYNCGCKHFFTLDTRRVEVLFRGKKKGGLRRRKICRHCKKIRFTIELDEEMLETAGEEVFPRKQSPPKKKLAPKPPDEDLPENPYLSD